MRANYIEFKTPQLAVLSQDQLEEIHLATLSILEDVGVLIDGPEEAIELLHGAGAYIGNDGLIKIPSYIIQTAIKIAPSTISLYNRNGNNKMILGGQNIYFGANTACLYYADPISRQMRFFETPDSGTMARVADALPNMDFVLSAAGFGRDVLAEIADQTCLMQVFMNTNMHVMIGTSTREGFRDMLDMAAIVAGGYKELAYRPIVSANLCPVDPMIHPAEYALEKILLCVERGIPYAYEPIPMGGATAPVTLAGMLLINNIDSLVGCVLGQLKKPGARYIYAGLPSPVDMKSGIFCYGTPEFAYLQGAIAQMARYYQLPVLTSAGITEAKNVDAQAGAECMMAMISSAMSGGQMIHDTGIMDHADLISPEMMVMTDEIIGRVKHFLRGMEISKESMGLEAIIRVGPGGNFMADEHTLNHFREVWHPNLSDRSRQAEPGTPLTPKMEDRINTRVREILETHDPEPLSKDIIKALKEVEQRWLRRIS